MTDSAPWTSREPVDEQMRAYVSQFMAELDKDKEQ